MAYRGEVIPVSRVVVSVRLVNIANRYGEEVEPDERIKKADPQRTRHENRKRV